jgi:hypothetical protein
MTPGVKRVPRSPSAVGLEKRDSFAPGLLDLLTMAPNVRQSPILALTVSESGSDFVLSR